MSNLHKILRLLKAPPCICAVRPVTTARNAVSLPSDLTDALETSEIKHRNHPGARKRKQVKLPEKLLAAADTVLEGKDMIKLREAAVLIRNQLWSRHLPIENDDLRSRAVQIEKELFGNAIERMSEEERRYVEEDVKERVFKSLRKRVRLWKPMKYDDFGARGYLVGRLAADYAVVHDVFHEIQHLNPAFAPASMMDFGSGLGSCFWAAKTIWPKYFQEYFSIDISAAMHSLARLLATGDRIYVYAQGVLAQQQLLYCPSTDGTWNARGLLFQRRCRGRSCSKKAGALCQSVSQDLCKSNQCTLLSAANQWMQLGSPPCSTLVGQQWSRGSILLCIAGISVVCTCTSIQA